MATSTEPIRILPGEHIRHMCKHLREAGVSHRDSHYTGADVCLHKCPESRCLLWDRTSDRASQAEYIEALTNWLASNTNVAAFARAYGVRQQTAEKWVRKIEKMGMTFYDNKLVCHPKRLAKYFDGEDIVPLTLDIDLTNRCNSKCPSCVGARQTETETLPGIDIDLLLGQAGRLGVKAAVFTGGGEPTLHREIVDLLAHATECGMAVALVTNGIILADRPDIVEAIVQHCTWVRISIDAGDRDMYIRTHGVDQYENVIEGLRLLAEEKQRQASKITIGAAYLTGPETILGIESCCQHVKTAGVDYFYLRPYLNDTTPLDVQSFQKAHNSSRFEVIGAKAYEHLQEKTKSYGKCGFGWWVSVVMADGTVTWCCRMRDKPQYYLGNIITENLETILKRRVEIEVDFKDCTVLCRGDLVNQFLNGQHDQVMHEAFL